MILLDCAGVRPMGMRQGRSSGAIYRVNWVAPLLLPWQCNSSPGPRFARGTAANQACQFKETLLGPRFFLLLLSASRTLLSGLITQASISALVFEPFSLSHVFLFLSEATPTSIPQALTPLQKSPCLVTLSPHLASRKNASSSFGSKTFLF